MVNYVKSEFYRVSRNRGVYLTIGACAALMLVMNLVMWHYGRQGEFRHANVGFSANMLITQMNLPMIVAVLFATVIFADEIKNRTINNCVAFGLSQTKVLFGKLFVTVLVSFAGMIIVESVLIGSAYLLLEDNGVNVIREMLRADLACAPCFIAACCVYYAFVFWLKSEINATWAWFVTIIGSSIVTELLGMKINFFQKLHGWMIYSLVTAYEVDEQTGGFTMIWNQTDGMTRIVSVGALWAVIFLAIAIAGIRKRA